tara:strand:+ start:693 stop:1625 length:933 start_codon:yes stop_codon:yes gene_type:complete
LKRLRLPGGLRLWVGGCSLLLVCIALWTHGQEVLALAPDQRGWGLLLLGLSFTVAAQWANGLAWWALLRWLQLPVPLLPMVLMFVRTNLLKYLPGGVWHQVSRVRLLRERGFSGRRALLSVLLEALLMVMAALCLIPLGGLQGGLALVSPMVLLLLRPRWLNPLLERLLRSKRRLLRSDQDAAPDSLETSPPERLVGTPWQPLLLEFPFLALRFAGFACCVQTFSDAAAVGWGGWIAAFALAWSAGLVVPGAPGGLGVFELVLLARLADWVPEAEVLAVLVSYRLISVLAELLAAGGAELDGRLDVQRAG